MKTKSKQPRKPAMDAGELRRLMEESGLTSKSEFAQAVGIHRITVYRWLDGTTPISEANRLLIRSKIKIGKK